MNLDVVLRASFNLLGCLLCGGAVIVLALSIVFRLSDALRRR